MTKRLMFIISAATVAAAAIFSYFMERGGNEPVRIGAVYSLTGTMAASEGPVLDGIRLAVERINAAGGVLGRPLELVVADGRSDADTAASEAARLIDEQKVSMLVACWTSACRLAVRPVVEERGALMFYPLQYEGLESSPNIVYTGAVPNQQLVPGTQWAIDSKGRRLYLVGSDYVFPREANAIVRSVVRARGGAVLAERYLPLGSSDASSVAAEIRRLRPDAVINTVNGDSNKALFKALVDAGLRSTPVVSFSVSESEMREMGGGELDEHYAAWSYFQSMKGEANSRFVDSYKARFGADKTTGDPVEAAYISVLLWAQGAKDAASVAPEDVGRTILRQTIEAPSGVLSVDRSTRHLWKTARVGKVGKDGLIEEVWATDSPLRPSPLPWFARDTKRTTRAARWEAGS